MAATKKAALYTLGCRLNQAETNILREKLEAAGYAVVPFGQPADLGIINTCTVTHEADAKSRKVIRSFIRTNPEAFTAVIGCYSQMGPAAIAAIPGVDLIIGNQEKLNVLDYVTPRKNGAPVVVRDRMSREDFTIESPGADPLSTRANLKIQDGCDFMCSFCIIPFARGRARSRAMDNLLHEARQLADRGAREIVLTGVNIGLYASDGLTILDVVDRLNNVDGLDRIRISSIEPTTIPEAFFGRMNDPAHALLPYLHVPMQSGSDAVLERMRRLYTREAYGEFLLRAAEAVPGIGLGTDIMVGMPGETDDDFVGTCALLENSPLAYAHVFKFSEREGAAAVRMPGKIPPEIKNRRSAVVRQLSQRKLRQFHDRHLGRTFRVLFEQEENGYWTGYTENYIRAAMQSDDILENVVCEVTLGESRGDMVLAHAVDAPALSS